MNPLLPSGVVQARCASKESVLPVCVCGPDRSVSFLSTVLLGDEELTSGQLQSLQHQKQTSRASVAHPDSHDELQWSMLVGGEDPLGGAERRRPRGRWSARRDESAAVLRSVDRSITDPNAPLISSRSISAPSRLPACNLTSVRTASALAINLVEPMSLAKSMAPSA